MKIANTPKPPYYAVIFTSIKNSDSNEYFEASKRMFELVKDQTGFLGVESARNEIGITVSYWKNLEAISNWKNNFEHKETQNKGKTDWYKSYTVRIVRVEDEYYLEK